MQRRDLLSHFSLGCLGSLASLPALATQPPAMWLANPYQGNEKLTDYWVSEKYDGIRGYWNGHQLLSRSGKALNPPNCTNLAYAAVRGRALGRAGAV